MEVARLRKGYTQRRLAAIITAAGVPVTDSHLSRIERGLFAPGPELRLAIAEALGIDGVNDLP